MNKPTVYANEAYVLICTEAGNTKTYSVHERLPFNEYGEAIAYGNTPHEAANNADKALGWLSVEA